MCDEDYAPNKSDGETISGGEAEDLLGARRGFYDLEFLVPVSGGVLKWGGGRLRLGEGLFGKGGVDQVGVSEFRFG